MQPTIYSLLSNYENGELSRRELVAGLFVLMTTGSTAAATGLKIGPSRP
jgi:hypothetical protein